MLTLEDIKKEPQVQECIKQSDVSLEVLGYTEHGLRHLNLAADRARQVAMDIGLDEREQELCAIAAFCHDMGNFMGRTQHHYWGGLLFHQIFQDRMEPEEVMKITQAIANHDKFEMKFTNPIGPILVLADKSDVHRSRVRDLSIEEIKKSIHNRVNYGATDSALTVGNDNKHITLKIELDTDFVPVMEYFEIFTERMSYCRRAADFLEYEFHLVMNDFELL